MEAARIAPPEIAGDEHGDARGPQVERLFRRMPWVTKGGERLGEKPHDVLACHDPGNRASQDVIEQQGRDRELGQGAAQGFFDDAIDPAPRKHRARFDIDGAHGIREEHHPKDKPRRGTADGLLRDAPDIKS